MISAWEEYWWNSITGPHQVVTSVAEGLLDKKTVVVQVPSDLPWRHEMRRAVQSVIKHSTGFNETNVEVIDAADDVIDDTEPGQYLLDRFGMYGIKNGYRAKSGLSIQEYLIKHEVLKDTIVWVKGLQPKQVAKWLKFCRAYAAPELSLGLFVLEAHQPIDSFDAKNVLTIAYESRVRRYDLQLFNSILLDNQMVYSDIWKQYISTLAAHLCVTDAEVSEQFIRVCDFRQEEPLMGLKNVLDCGGFDRRGAESASKHILALLRRNDTNEIARRVWAAQLQVLYPFIELRRLETIDVLRLELERCIARERIEQFGVVIDDIKDIELGTLAYILAQYSDDGCRFINVPDKQFRSDIRFLRDCRNLLAHGNACSVDMVVRLFGLNIRAYEKTI